MNAKISKIMQLGLGLLLVLLSQAPAAAERLHIAVASNFAAVMVQLVEQFQARYGHELLISYGASGVLYAQIRNGAPFTVLLSADSERPRRLEVEGLAVAGSRFTYARGRLVLWSRQADLVDSQGKVLRQGDFRYLAIANPELAPYGTAAKQVLQHLNLWESLQPRLVQGENISQTYQFVASGNAELGFVAAAQLVGNREGSVWQVPLPIYQPIEQQAVLLAAGAEIPAAKRFLMFLRSAEARSLIQAAGYEVSE